MPYNEDDFTSQFLSQRDQAQTIMSIQSLDRAFGEDSELPSTPQDKEKQEADGSFKFVKDIGRGITEIPIQALGGFRDAVQETVNMTEPLARWLSENVGNFGLGEEGDPITLPEVKEASSVTGGVIRNVSQFLTGFAGAGKIKLLKQIGGVKGATVKGAVADFSVFDPHEERLSNLIQENENLRNPVTEYLAASPDDSQAEGRFKNALEGLGLGAMTEGFMHALKAMRSVRIARATMGEGAPSLSVTATDFDFMGDASSKSYLIKKKVKEAVEDTATTKIPTDELFINWNRINEPEDIKKVIQLLADQQKESIDVARRGVRTHLQTELAAEKINAWDALMSRGNGGLNAEESLAARQLWATSGEKVAEIAKQAATNPSDTNLFAFRKMVAIHHAIQKEVIGARTETARALNAWKIPAGSNADNAMQINNLIAESGGLDVTRELAKRISVLADAKRYDVMEHMISEGAFARTRDAVAQVWINGMLTNPATHVVNTLSNTSVAVQQIFERRTAHMLGKLFGEESAVKAGEAMAMVYGMVEGVKDSLRLNARGRKVLLEGVSHLVSGKGKQAFKDLISEDENIGSVYKSFITGRTGFGINKIDLPRVGALSSETWNVASDTWLGRSMDMVDTATQLPGRMLGTADEFFKSIGYRMELNAQAVRQASNEISEGLIDNKAFKSRIAEILQNPPDNIRLKAIDAATYQTFTRETDWLPRKIADVIQQVPVLGRLLIPFKRTPVNILSYTMERTPFAPVVKEWRADILAGGARADIALARMSTGSALLLAAMDLAWSGVISGEGPSKGPKKDLFLRQRKQSYSAKVGDTWYSYSRLDPIGMTLGIGADVAEIIHNSQSSEEEIETTILASTLAIAKNVTSKTYMQGISRFFDAISDPDRYGSNYFEGIAGSLVPTGLAAIARVEDPYLKQANSMLDTMKKRTPWWNQDLPDYRDLWGRKVSFQSELGAVYDLMSPVYVKKENPEAIDSEMERLEYYPDMPSKKLAYGNVVVDLEKNPHAYARYVQLAGNDLKHPVWNVGAMDLLNSIVKGEHPLSVKYQLFSDGPEGGKADMIRDIISEYRKLARAQLISEFKDIAVEVETEADILSKYDPAVIGR